MSDDLFHPGSANPPSHHPDFGKIVETIRWFDGASNGGGKTFSEAVADMGVNPETVMYVARQRAMRTPYAGTPDVPPEAWTAMTTLWMEAFYIGVRFARRT